MKLSARLLLLIACCYFGMQVQAQTVTSFEGIDASQLSIQGNDIDPNGAVGTKQYMQWVNPYYQAYDKVTGAPVWSTPQRGVLPWYVNGQMGCTNIAGDGVVMFDRLASRWVIGGRSQQSGQYYYCVAVSNTDDLTSKTLKWYTYQISLNPILGTNSLGSTYFPDWPKLGVWQDGYYLSIDLEDTSNKYREIGVVVCALDRQNMLSGLAQRTPQCFSDPNPIPTSGSLYLSHSVIPADIGGTTAPPAGRDEFLVSIQNPPADGVSSTSTTVNLWEFHTDWNTPSNSTLTKSPVSVPIYTPGCYSVTSPANTYCVLEPSLNLSGQHYHIDSVGDRIMPRFEYQAFPTYESFLFSHTVQVSARTHQTGIRWVELRGDGVTAPTYWNSGIVSPDTLVFRTVPSIAQDKNADAAVGYTVASPSVHPGIRASTFNLRSAFAPSEIVILNGAADEQNAKQWGDYTSMTVDPVDGCTFWYTNEYFMTNQVGTPLTWQTRIAHFKLATCQ